MCGIAGIVSKEPEGVNVHRLKKMTDIITHRGPDGEGHWINEKHSVGLGHRRLSIIDLSDAGKQPMHYLGRYTITFNGEIYNYIEIRETLVQRGYRFHSHSDTEVLMALYDCKREKCLDELDGMFAFAIYDNQEETLFCARDRFGEKPFHYYYEAGKCFVFASEMKQIWAAGIERKVDHKMLYNYLQFSALNNPSSQEQTFYTSIKRLEQSHYLTIDIKEIKMKTVRYWDIHSTVDSRLTLEQAANKFNELFYTSIKRRLRSDVPVGSSLSGGLDSSLVVCVIDKLNKDKKLSQKTFSARFPGYAKDESFFQQLVIDKTSAEAHFTFPNEVSMLEEIDRVFYHQEEPFASSSILAQFEVFKLAKTNGVTVLLDGQGADEILGGYHSYFPYFFQEIAKDRALFKKQWEGYLTLHQQNTVNATSKLGIQHQLRTKLPGSISVLKKLRKKLINNRGYLSKDFYEQNKPDEFDFNSEFSSLGDILAYSTLKGPLQELLRYADRNSMAHSREVRLPFLSHELVSFLFTLPAEMKINNGWTKYLMRVASESVLPKEIGWRIDKIGYEPPQKKWMETAEVKDLVNTYKRKLVADGILDKAVLQKQEAPGTATQRGDNSWAYWMSGKLIGGE